MQCLSVPIEAVLLFPLILEDPGRLGSTFFLSSFGKRGVEEGTSTSSGSARSADRAYALVYVRGARDSAEA